MVLFGVLPVRTWPFFLAGPKYQLLLPLVIYLCLPAAAWWWRSKKVALCIPAAPFLGFASCYVQFWTFMAPTFH